MLETDWFRRLSGGRRRAASRWPHAGADRSASHQVGTAVLVLADRGVEKAALEAALPGHRFVRLHQAAALTLTTGLDQRAAAGIGDDELVAIDLGETEAYDVAVLDLGLPRIEGTAVLRAWRAAGKSLPVLMLTARDGWSEKVEGFKAGADDYLIKPFRVEELVMRLRALVRRAAGHAEPRIHCGKLIFDSQLGTFELDGLPLRLTALEWRLLSCLALRKEVVVNRGDLLERAYQGDAEVDSNSLEVIIGRLRRKIGHGMIETTRGRGYRLTAAA